jgi:hypothetical protein
MNGEKHNESTKRCPSCGVYPGQIHHPRCGEVCQCGGKCGDRCRCRNGDHDGQGCAECARPTVAYPGGCRKTLEPRAISADFGAKGGLFQWDFITEYGS